MLSRLTAHKRISTGAEIGQRLGFTADAIDPRIEAIQHDDWKATNRRAALKLSVAVFGRRAVHEVAENASGLGRRQSTASNADHEPNCATKGRTRRTRKKSRVLRSRHAAHGHLDDNHGTSADQVSAGHVDVDCPTSHRGDDVLAGTGCAGVCARKRLAGPDRADRAAVKRSSPDAVHDDLIALGPQLADRPVHRRRAGRSGVRSSGQSERGGCQCSSGECGEEEAFHIRTFRAFLVKFRQEPMVGDRRGLTTAAATPSEHDPTGMGCCVNVVIWGRLATL